MNTDIARLAQESAWQLIGSETPYSKIGRERRRKLRMHIETELIKFYRMGKMDKDPDDEVFDEEQAKREALAARCDPAPELPLHREVL